MALWCSLSVTSRWVREEVHLAHDLGILVPVKIEPCEIPFGFRLADTIDLAGWDGAPRSPALDPLIDALEGRIGRDAVPDRKALIEYEATWRRFGARTLKDFALNAKLAQAEARRFGPEEADDATACATACGGQRRKQRPPAMVASRVGSAERQHGHRTACSASRPMRTLIMRKRQAGASWGLECGGCGIRRGDMAEERPPPAGRRQARSGERRVCS